jgi:hypothetical protein
MIAWQGWHPEPIGHVSTEGGPLLLGDRASLVRWTGSEGDDYERLTTAFAASEPPAVEIHDDEIEALAWSVPTGTTDVWRVWPTSILLTRSWLGDSDGDSLRLAAAPFAPDAPALGRVRITSGWLGVMWAAETGSDPSVGHSALSVALEAGDYECLSDEVRIPGASAMRCLILQV